MGRHGHRTESSADLHSLLGQKRRLLEDAAVNLADAVLHVVDRGAKEINVSGLASDRRVGIDFVLDIELVRAYDKARLDYAVVADRIRSKVQSDR